MEKRFILFILICLVAFPLYMKLVLPEPEPAAPGTSPPGASAPATPGPSAPAGGATSAVPGPAQPAGATPGGAATPASVVPASSYPSRTIVLENPVLRVEIATEGAAVRSVTLPAYVEADRETPLALASPELRSGGGLLVRPAGIAGEDLPLDTLPWEVVEEAPGRVVLRHPLGGAGAITKSYELPPEGYELGVAVTIECELTPARDASYQLLGPERIRYDTGSAYPNQRVAGLLDSRGRVHDADHRSVGKLPQRLRVDDRPIAWGGLESNYFSWVIRPDVAGDGSRPKLVELGVPEALVEDEGGHEAGRQEFPYRVGFRQTIVPGRTDRFAVFLGPKDPEVLEAYAEHGYLELIDYGTLGWLVRLFLFLLRTFEALTSSWGLAIILLTVLVKTLLHPVNKRNQRTMQRQQKKMAAIQPEMRAVREKHKNDPLKANQEIQKLFREHGVNPAQMFGGCLMIFLQLPIWIGLINTFRLAIELRQASFLWIADLTAPDRALELPFTLPFYGTNWLNILPFLYVGVTLVNQRMMPRSDDPQMRQQQKMMTFMMVAFGFIFYEFASGLMVYFLTSASLGIIEQKIIRAELRHEEAKAGSAAPPPPDRPAGPAGPALPKPKPPKSPKPKRPR